MFKPVESVPDFAKIEEKILDFWKKNKIFEKSIEQRPVHKRWTLLDGPPFVTGSPHYGSLLSSLPKDLFGRYWTMKGYRVRRVWGWDGHGLPIENKVEGELKIKRKRDIEEKVGVKKFIEECKKYVNQVSAEWQWYIDHIGRWVNFKNAYKTWDLAYMESVMWVFKQMYEKEYVYKGLRVSLYCPHCATPISNFEVAMDADNYKDVAESATTYKYQLVDEKDTYLLAWSTTPWNKIATPALAVNPKLTYVKVKQGDEYYILAEKTLKTLGGKPKYEIVNKFKGEVLVGKKFVPHYDFYKIEKDKKAFVILGGNFVTEEEGTGVVTLAVYGEEDLEIMQKKNVQLVFHVDEEGVIKDGVPKFGGMYYLKANKVVNEDLTERNLIYKNEEYTHNVAHCWRCGTRLFFSPQTAWYVNAQKLKPTMKKTNELVNWFPSYFKYGRFLKSMGNAPDWNISRNRYWGSPVPVWECECGERFVPGSISELEKASGAKIKDLHKPEIDEVTVTCKKCGKSAKRTPEVLDSWIEAGSASFAERHFPFSKEEKLEDFFPPDFIAEYTGQIRAWFYVLHVIGAALYESPAFKNVLVEGVILGTDGRKMSKNYNNYPNPKEMLQKYGGDALRLYLLGSPVMKGEDILIAEEPYRNQVKGLLLVLWNVYKFFITYANLNKFAADKEYKQSDHELDQWIVSLLHKLIEETTDKLDSYDTISTINLITEFIQDLSVWYVRRSRKRANSEEFLNTLYFALINLTKLLAPIAPFTAEEIYKNLSNEESVHLTDWPTVEVKKKKQWINENLINRMDQGRKLVEMAHSVRKDAGIKLRTPLASLGTVSPMELGNQISEIVRDEVNVKQHINTVGEALNVNLNTNLTKELKREGEAREIIRKIQSERKKLGTDLSETVDVQLEEWPMEFEEEIKRKALVENLIKDKDFKVIRK